MGYQPKPEDLDYPARLERLAVSSPETLPAAAANLVEVNDVNVRTPCQPTSGVSPLMLINRGLQEVVELLESSIRSCPPTENTHNLYRLSSDDIIFGLDHLAEITQLLVSG